MSVIGGLSQMAGAVASATVLNPLQTGARMLGTGLETMGRVAHSLSEGDLAGAGHNYLNGIREQGSNVGRHFQGMGEAGSHLLEGYGEYASSGLQLLGQPVETCSNLAQTSARTWGRVGAALSSGDAHGAADAYAGGLSRAGDLYQELASTQVERMFGR